MRRMRLKDLFPRLVTDIKKSALDKDLRYQIQYRYMLKILFVVVLVSAALDLLTARYTMGILLILLAVVYFGFYWIVYLKKEQGVKIVNWLMMISSLIICCNVLVHGTIDGSTVAWLLLFPILSFLLLGMKMGAISSLALLLCIVFLFWTPVGNGLLLHEYRPAVMERFPFIYIVMMGVSAFNEAIRIIIIDELLEKKDQMEAVYQNQYYSVTKRIAEAKRIRHDERHHFVMITQYLRDNKVDEALEYINQYYEALPFEESLTYCDHYATNALMTYYVESAKTQGVPSDVQLQIPTEIPFRTDDLTVILGNLLENAVQASISGMKEATFQPKVKVSGRFDGNALIMMIENNSLEEAKQDEDNRYISSKHEGRGIGIHSVRTMVEKYGGQMAIEQKNHTFKVSFVMYAQ